MRGPETVPAAPPGGSVQALGPRAPRESDEATQLVRQPKSRARYPIGGNQLARGDVVFLCRRFRIGNAFLFNIATLVWCVKFRNHWAFVDFVCRVATRWNLVELLAMMWEMIYQGRKGRLSDHSL